MLIKALFDVEVPAGKLPLDIGMVVNNVGTMAGAVVLILLQNILTTLNIPPFGRQVIFGVTLLGLMLLYGRQRRLRG